jgi:fatty-acyl-CoA synthase
VLVDRSLLPLPDRSSRARHRAPRHRDGRRWATPPGKLDYEQLIGPERSKYDWPVLDENSAAAICYTSGTTGNPKGVVYSHRSSVLHTIVACHIDSMAASEASVLMPVVPMFHANAWGWPHIAACVGAKLVFPGPKLDPETLLDLMVKERVTATAGVPTIWLGILALLDAKPKGWDLSCLSQMVVGGSAAPPAMIEGFEKRHGIRVRHAWGMTETNPLGTVDLVKHGLERQVPSSGSGAVVPGYAVPFVETRHTSDDGRALLGRRTMVSWRWPVGGFVVPGRRRHGSMDEGRLVRTGTS